MQLETVCLTDISFEPDLSGLLTRLRIDSRPEYAERFMRLARAAVPLARPKAIYGVGYIDAKQTDSVVVNGTTLTSRVLRVNLDQVQRVFPFVATCGAEIETWAQPIADMLERFWADAIMEEALRCAFDALDAHLTRTYALGHTAFMSPGSLEDWPLAQQPMLFQLLGDVFARIGVKLNDSFIMTPMKSVSGVRFPSEASFESCQLCPRDPCPERRAPYDPELYETRYMQGRQ